MNPDFAGVCRKRMLPFPEGGCFLSSAEPLLILMSGSLLSAVLELSSLERVDDAGDGDVGKDETKYVGVAEGEIGEGVEDDSAVDECEVDADCLGPFKTCSPSPCESAERSDGWDRLWVVIFKLLKVSVRSLWKGSGE